MEAEIMEYGRESTYGRAIMSIALLIAVIAITGALDYFGVLLKGESQTSNEMPVPHIVKLDEKLKIFDRILEEKIWDDEFIVARVYPERFNGQPVVVVRRRPNDGSPGDYRTALGRPDEVYLVGDAVEYGHMGFHLTDSVRVTTTWFFVRK
jgi:hypothetical protein